MATVTIQKQSTEPGVRVLRSILAWVIGVAAVVPIILGAIVLPKGTELSVVVTTIVAVSTGITALIANPTINDLLAKVGLGASTVTKLKTATLAAAEPAVAAGTAAYAAAQAVQADVAAGDTTAAIVDSGIAAANLSNAISAEVPLVQNALNSVAEPAATPTAPPAPPTAAPFPLLPPTSAGAVPPPV